LIEIASKYTSLGEASPIFRYTNVFLRTVKLRSTPLTTHVDVSTTSDSSHGKSVSALTVFVQNIVQTTIANIVNKATYFLCVFLFIENPPF